jgi:hypothetical protein
LQVCALVKVIKHLFKVNRCGSYLGIFICFWLSQQINQGLHVKKQASGGKTSKLFFEIVNLQLLLISNKLGVRKLHLLQLPSFKYLWHNFQADTLYFAGIIFPFFNF